VLTRVWLEGRAVALPPLPPLGHGGEADVYDLGDGRALKILKTPDHPEVAGDPALERAAAARLASLGARLAAFPAAVPAAVARPGAPAIARRGGERVGYAMPRLPGTPLYHLGEPRWRRAHPVAAATVVAAFRHLHATLDALHQAGVVIGDFNDGNVLVDGERCGLVDADSWQYGGARVHLFQERFVDPRLCDPAASAPVLVRAHDADSDWFAFAAMLLRSLLWVGPYGGVLAAARRVPPAARPLRGISVLDPDVVYPRAALPPAILPDDLVGHFQAVFAAGRRGRFPPALLETLRFTRCACGAEHARRACPVCRTTVAVPATVARGQLRVTRLDPAAVAPPPPPRAWLDGATLWRATPLGPEPIGQVLAGHTRIWVGEHLGVGLWRAGGYTRAFVFRPDRRGLCDGVALPPWRGRLVDVAGVPGTDVGWLWWREAHAGADTLGCAAIAATGTLLGVATASAADPGWLAGVPGACAVGPALLVPTDAGVVRVEVGPAGPAITRAFPDTAPWVGAADTLVPAPGGLDVHTRDGVLRLALT
jgi:hypothetical protein